MPGPRDVPVSARRQADAGRVAGVLLAAGEGRRLGRPKALVAWHGSLLVERGARMLAAGGCDRVVVVLGASAADVIDVADLSGGEVVVNESWASGIAGSLRVGLAAAGAADAAVVALVDQPHVTAAVVRRLLATWRAEQDDAVVAAYRGQPRNPVVLAAAVWDEACAAAHDDVGARAWLRRHPERVRLVECADLGDGRDVDTVADLDG